VTEDQVVPDKAKKIHAEFQPDWTDAVPVRNTEVNVARKFNHFR
jgi:hypothetical protein